MRRRRLAAVAGLLLLALALDAPEPAAAQGPATVEATYAAVGPAGDAVTTGTVGTTHRLYFPTDLGGAGDRHAVVAWGNGSFEHPDTYESLLRHLASWGFIVVAAETDSAGTGQEILDGARFVIAADADPASPFFGHVDGSHVAAVGHSQGAGGSMRAASEPGGPITTVVPVALPAELFELLGVDHDYDPAQVPARVPALFMSGEADTIISPPGAVARFYGQVPGPAAMGILRGADHNTVQLDGGGFRGYLTAWLRFQLAGDPFAAGAFVGPSPELLGNPSWRDARVKDLTMGGPSGPSGPPGASGPSWPSGASTTTAVPAVGPAGPGASGPLPATGGHAPTGAAVVVALALVLARRRGRRRGAQR